MQDKFSIEIISPDKSILKSDANEVIIEEVKEPEIKHLIVN